MLTGEAMYAVLINMHGRYLIVVEQAVNLIITSNLQIGTHRHSLGAGYVTCSDTSYARYLLWLTHPKLPLKGDQLLFMGVFQSV